MRWAVFLVDRLKRRLWPLVPILAASAAIFFLLWLIFLAVRGLLPAGVREMVDLVADGSFAQAGERLRAKFDALGVWSAPAFVGMQSLQVLVAPIPGQLTGFLGGALFGFWKGLGLTMTGLSVGSFTAMVLARLFGRPLAERFIPPKERARFDELVESGGVETFFVIFLLPALPDDAACFAAGLTRLPLARLMFVCLVGRAPGMAVLTYVGAGAGEGERLAWILLWTLVALGVAAWFFEDEITAGLRRLRGR